MRTGEVCALTWDDIDLKNRTISINHNVYCKDNDVNGRWYFGTPKTINGIRTVHINSILLKVLTNYKNKQNCNKKKYGSSYKLYHLEDVKNDYGKVLERKIVETKNNRLPNKDLRLVFVKSNGKYSGTDIIRYPFKIIHHELGINCRFYDLRGSFATISLRNGCEIKDIAEVLGHKRIETTEKYYISSTSKDIQNVSQLFESNINVNNINLK